MINKHRLSETIIMVAFLSNAIKSTRVCVCVCVCVFVCVHNNSIHLKLEHIVMYENSSQEFNMSAQGQGHGVTLKFFFIYHNTNYISALAYVKKFD